MRATTGNSGAKALRERLKKPEILIAPGAYDCCLLYTSPSPRD